MPKCSASGCCNCEDLRFCTGCFEAVYCSKECQSKSWKRAHQYFCWGRKLIVISRSLEIALFGSNSGGSPYSQLERVLSTISSSAAVDEVLHANEPLSREPDETKNVVGKVLELIYMPPVVEISSKQFAVFSPYCYHGHFPTISDALYCVKVLTAGLQLSRKDRFTVCVPGPRGFTSESIKSGEVELIDWAEHSHVAPFLSRYIKPQSDSPSSPCSTIKQSSDSAEFNSNSYDLSTPALSSLMLTAPQGEMWTSNNAEDPGGDDGRDSSCSGSPQRHSSLVLDQADEDEQHDEGEQQEHEKEHEVLPRASTPANVYIPILSDEGVIEFLLTE